MDDECWKNSLNKGKGRQTAKFRWDNKTPSSKGQPCANVIKEDSNSDAKLQTAFITNVTIENDSEMKEAKEAQFSAYSWIADSGTSMHICAQCEAFLKYTALPNKVIKGLGDKLVTTCDKGTVIIRTHIGNCHSWMRLTGTLHVLKARENLVFLRCIDAAGGSAVCEKWQIKIYDAQHNNIAIGKLENNLYYLNVIIEASLTTNVAIKIRNSYTWEQWHCRLGHIGITGL